MTQKKHSDLYMYLWLALLGAVLICAKGTEYYIPWANTLAHKWFPHILAPNQLLYVTYAGYFFGLTYLLSSTFSDVYGYGSSRKTCMFNYLINLVLVIVTFIGEWQQGVPITGGTWRILAGSLVAGFVSVNVCDLIGDILFQKLRERDSKQKTFWIRAAISAIVADCLDALVFTFIFQRLSFGTPFKIIWITLLFYIPIKTGSKLVVLPLAQIFTRKLRNLEGEEAFEPRSDFNWLGFKKKA